MNNVDQTIISQYANSPVILTLIRQWNLTLDTVKLFSTFITYVLDVATAQGFGLDILGRIVGVNRLIQIPPFTEYFGFDPAFQPFGQGPFYRAGAVIGSTTTFNLSDTAFRSFIKAKALSNISGCSIPNMNTILTVLFPGRGKIYVLDLGGMQLEYHSEFHLLDYEKSMIKSLFHPSGVGITIVSP